MFCINCGQKATESSKFCINCGEPFKNAPDPTPTHQTPIATTATPNGFFQKINVGNVVKVLIGLAVVGFIIYSNVDEQAIETNNEALNSYNTGNNQDAISQLESASQSAVSGDTKLNTLKNLAYVYSTEDQDEKALQTFKEALGHAEINSFDYYLVLGEIAYLESKPSIAKQHYEKAYAMNTADFQINNALALFYMDADDLHPQYRDTVKAVQFAKAAHSANNSHVTIENLSVALVLNEDYTEALTYLNQINLQQSPYMHVYLGLAYAGLENVQKAKYHFQQYVNTGEEVPPEINDYLRNN